MIATNDGDVASPWHVEQAAFHVEGGRVDDLGVFDRSPTKERVLEAGTAWFFARAELARGRDWTGVVRADARRMRIRIAGRRNVMDAQLSAAAESTRRDLAEGALRDVELALKESAASDGKGPAEKGTPPFEVGVRAERVVWNDFPPGVARGRATLTAPKLEPLLEALGAPPILLSVWPDAPFDASARFEVEPKELDVALDLAESGPFRAMGRLRVCSPARGAFLVKSGSFSVGLFVHGGSVRVVPLASTAWLAHNVPTCPRER
jgi:hypothetical protein